jgi:hypothetical protein
MIQISRYSGTSVEGRHDLRRNSAGGDHAWRHRVRPMAMVAALAALLGGVVLFGSNNATSRQLSQPMKNAEALRAALIARLDIRLVGDASANLPGASIIELHQRRAIDELQTWNQSAPV